MNFLPWQKSLLVGIFLDSAKVRCWKPCKVITSVKLCTFISVLVMWVHFQDHRTVSREKRIVLTNFCFIFVHFISAGSV